MNTRLALLSGIGLMALGIASASAQEQTAQANIPSITVTDTKQKAIDVAPSVAPLDAIQPESLVARKFIEENIPLSSNYDDVIKYTPSVNGVSPNGPGLMENQILSIRGFQDGQFNVTFDGIPWGDANDFTHHTTSYFMGHDLGSVLVDRGPGTAATIGNATFGGTIAVQSKDPLSTFTLNPYATYGSFNTSVVGGEVDSGRIEKYRDTTVLLDVEGLNSDGYLTNASQNRQNVFGKVVTPLGPTTTLTVVGMLNEIDQHFASGATAAQLAQFGPNFGLSKNPGDMNYFAYNHDIIQTDFEYAGVKSSFGDGWSLDAKVYTYAYYHSGTQGADQANTLTNNSISTFFGPGEVPGTLLQNDYRSIGTTDTIKKEFAYFDIQTGIWFDHQINRRSLFDVNLAGNNAIDTSLDANGVQREIHQTLDTIQPFVQVDVKPIPDLVI